MRKRERIDSEWITVGKRSKEREKFAWKEKNLKNLREKSLKYERERREHMRSAYVVRKAGKS